MGIKDQDEINFEDLHERRRQKRVYSVVFWALLVIYSATLVAALVLFRSPLFRVRSLSVTGNAAISTDAVLDVVRGMALDGRWRPFKAMLGFRSMLTWPGGVIHAPALLPGARDITIEKDYGAGSVAIRVEERAPYGIWCFGTPTNQENAEGQQCWWFDGEGVVFKRAYDASGGILTVVHDYSQRSPGSLSKILPNVFIKNFFSIFGVLRSSELGVKEIALHNLSLQELAVSTHDGPMLYFSLRFPATNALAAIQNLMGKPGFGKLQYLDFRAENRVYYK